MHLNHNLLTIESNLDEILFSESERWFKFIIYNL